jgi:hypothetical protein
MTKQHNSRDLTDDDDDVDWDSEPEIKEVAPEKRNTIDPAARRRIEQLLDSAPCSRVDGFTFNGGVFLDLRFGVPIHDIIVVCHVAAVVFFAHESVLDICPCNALLIMRVSLPVSLFVAAPYAQSLPCDNSWVTC